MLDFDLAEMYGIENRVLKQAVRRKSKRHIFKIAASSFVQGHNL